MVGFDEMRAGVNDSVARRGAAIRRRSVGELDASSGRRRMRDLNAYAVVDEKLDIGHHCAAERRVHRLRRQAIDEKDHRRCGCVGTGVGHGSASSGASAAPRARSPGDVHPSNAGHVAGGSGIAAVLTAAGAGHLA